MTRLAQESSSNVRVTLAEHKVHIPDEYTVYQAKIMAIKEAAKILPTIHDLTTIKIYVDSQAALRTFQADFIKSKLALQTIHALNKVQHLLMVFVLKLMWGPLGMRRLIDWLKMVLSWKPFMVSPFLRARPNTLSRRVFRQFGKPNRPDTQKLDNPIYIKQNMTNLKPKPSYNGTNFKLEDKSEP